MSTIGYAALTNLRKDRGRPLEGGPPAQGQTSSPASAVQTYVDAMAALVPAEVLVLHASIISFTVTKVDGAVRVTAPQTLSWVFFALLVLSGAMYLFQSRSRLDRWDIARMLLPPAAFVLWTMLQQSTAFDAVAPGLAREPRYAIALIGAVIVGTTAAALAKKADP